MRTGWQVAGGVAAALVVFTALEAQQAESRRIATAPAFGRAYSEADLKDIASYSTEELAR